TVALANWAQLQTFETNLHIKVQDADVAIQQARIDLDFLRTNLDSLKPAFTKGAVPDKTLRDAQRRVQVAEAEYRGKLQVRDILRQARQDLQAILPSTGGPSETHRPDNSHISKSLPSLRVLLHAPLAGTATAAEATEGEFVKTTRSLFTVINLDKVWVEARIPESDLERVVRAPAATFALAAYPGRTFAILGERGGRLINVGSVVDSASRTLPIRY